MLTICYAEWIYYDTAYHRGGQIYIDYVLSQAIQMGQMKILGD